jgi:hypothetical protein
MPLTVDRYTILLADEPAANPREVEVALVNGDRLRAELEGPKQGVPTPDVKPMHYMTICLWAACLRSKVIKPEVDFPTFAEMCLDFEEVKEEPQFPGSPVVEDPMGPTAAGTGSPSSLPTSSESSPAGSTPPPTPAL